MHVSRLLLPVLLLVVGGVAFGDASGSACQSLNEAFPDQVLFPDSTPYDTTVLSYNYIPVRLHPTCFFKPRDTAQVAQAVDILGTKHNDTKYAVRGGGHNTNPGFANIVDGVTIDLTEMDAVEVLEQEQVVRVGGGAHWQQVYDAIEPKGLSVSGGRIGIVGVAGLTTGSGVSFFSPAKGWVCDSVTNFEIVLSDSTVVNANMTSNPDLFAALKGGLNNFGIVTQITFKTFVQGPLWGGTILYESSNETHSKLLSALTDYKKADNFDPDGSMWLGLIYNSTSKAYMTHASFFLAKPEEAPGPFKPFVDIGPQIFAQITTEPAGNYARNFSLGSRVDPISVLWAVTTFKWSPTILHEIYDLWESYLNPKLPAFTTSSLSLQSIPPPPREGEPQNVLGFPTDSSPEKELIQMQIIMEYLDPAVIDELLELTKAFETEVDNLTKSKELYHKFRYMNYAGWWQDVMGGYGEEAVAKLKSAAQKYDPVGMFQNQVVGGFKLPK